jgi:hypothetical protein
VYIGEVQYFFRLPYEDYNKSPEALAVVSLWSEPHILHLQRTHGTVWSAKYSGQARIAVVSVKKILSVVGMVPHLLERTRAGCKVVDGGRGSLSTVRGCESRERAHKGERKETHAEERAMDKGDHATSASSPEARCRRHRARSGQSVQAGDVVERGLGERWVL